MSQNKTTCNIYGDFAVCLDNNKEPFLVDSDLVSIVEKHSWCKSNGYPAARINGKLKRLHELVYETDNLGSRHEFYVDHMNQDKTDNRRRNLRLVTPEDSAKNMPLRIDNTSGFTGVTKTKNNTYRAYITINGKQKNLGYYKNLEDAVNARNIAEKELGFSSTRKTIKDVISEEK